MKLFLLLSFLFSMTTNSDRDAFLSKLVDPEDVIARVNDRFDKLFIVGRNGNRRPQVCCVCDEARGRRSDGASKFEENGKGAEDFLMNECARSRTETRTLNQVFVQLLRKQNWVQG